MSKIKVGHLIYSKKVGGSEIVAANVCSALDRSQFDPLVLFMLKSQGEMSQILHELYVPCKCLNLPWRPLPFESLYIAHLLNRLRVDILHIHHIPLYLRVIKAVKMSRVRGVVFTEHAKYSIEKSKKLQNACRLAAQQANAFTTVSADLKEYFVRELNLSDDLVQVILNGVDVRRFKPDKKSSVLRSMLPENFTGKILIHVGRLVEAKDHETLLTAMNQVVRIGHEVFLFLIGEGELKPVIEQRISELRLTDHVKMLGMRSDVDQLLLGADIFVMSSKREGLPMVLMEAMSCALPVIATDVGGISEIVNDQESGLLVAPENPYLLARAIEGICNRADGGSALGKKARQIIIENYSLEATAESYAELYNKILFP